MSKRRQIFVLVLFTLLVGLCAFASHSSLTRYLRDRAKAPNVTEEYLKPLYTEAALREKLGRGVSMAVGGVGAALGILLVSLKRGFAYHKPGQYFLAQWMIILAIRYLIQRDWLWGGVATFAVAFIVANYLMERRPSPSGPAEA